MTDVSTGRVDFGLQTMVSVLPLAKDKRVKVLAIGGLTRSDLLPEVPTMAESMPGFELSAWYGVLGPAKMPPVIVKRLNDEIANALRDPDMKVRLAQQGMEPLTSSAEGYASYMRRDFDRWAKTIKAAGVKLE
jgi:tripartite-type tricarboxylate transporter receptor subunit TctC